MSSYTMQLKTLCDIFTRQKVESWFSNYNLLDYLTPKQIEVITKAGIWTKEKLAKKIVNHFFMREIGFETPALFEFQVKAYMNEIMEKYLPVIYSNSIEFDPLVNVDFTETFERNIEGTAQNQGKSNSNSNSNSSGLTINSDTPQGQISKDEILKGNFASNTSASENESNIKDTTETTNSGNSNTSENYTKHQKGNSGISTTAQYLIMQYRESLVAVDNQIINELSILFMGIF